MKEAGRRITNALNRVFSQKQRKATMPASKDRPLAQETEQKLRIQNASLDSKLFILGTYLQPGANVTDNLITTAASATTQELTTKREIGQLPILLGNKSVELILEQAQKSNNTKVKELIQLIKEILENQRKQRDSTAGVSKQE